MMMNIRRWSGAPHSKTKLIKQRRHGNYYPRIWWAKQYDTDPDNMKLWYGICD